MGENGVGGFEPGTSLSKYTIIYVKKAIAVAQSNGNGHVPVLVCSQSDVTDVVEKITALASAKKSPTGLLAERTEIEAKLIDVKKKKNHPSIGMICTKASSVFEILYAPLSWIAPCKA